MYYVIGKENYIRVLPLIYKEDFISITTGLVVGQRTAARLN